MPELKGKVGVAAGDFKALRRLDAYNSAMVPDGLAAFSDKHGVRLLLQFGSTISDRTHARSDLDLAVLLERAPVSFDSFGEMAADLQTMCPGTEIDIAVINQADPLLLKQILERCRLLYGAPRALSELKMYAYKRYQDHRRFLAMERAYVTRRIATLTS